MLGVTGLKLESTLHSIDCMQTVEGTQILYIHVRTFEIV